MMMNNELPPIEESCIDTGVACVPCNNLNLAADGICGYLKRGEQWAEDKRALEGASYDPLLDGYYTELGVKRLIAADAELAGQFLGGRVGMAIVDLRGVKGVNELYNYTAGNGLIIAGAQRLPGVRTAVTVEPHTPERRAEPATHPDIFMRGQNSKSDELVVIMRGVHTPAEMDHILQGRILPTFSVEQAIIDSSAGKIPVVANGAASHSSEFGSAKDNAAGAADIFNQMLKATLDKLSDDHETQYNLMWQSVLDMRHLADKGMDLARPADDRNVATIFWEVCCPDFARNAKELLAQMAGEAAPA